MVTNLGTCDVPSYYLISNIIYCVYLCLYLASLQCHLCLTLTVCSHFQLHIPVIQYLSSGCMLNKSQVVVYNMSIMPAHIPNMPSTHAIVSILQEIQQSTLQTIPNLLQHLLMSGVPEYQAFISAIQSPTGTCLILNTLLKYVHVVPHH